LGDDNVSENDDDNGDEDRCEDWDLDLKVVALLARLVVHKRG